MCPPASSVCVVPVNVERPCGNGRPPGGGRPKSRSGELPDLSTRRRRRRAARPAPTRAARRASRPLQLLERRLVLGAHLLEALLLAQQLLLERAPLRALRLHLLPMCSFSSSRFAYSARNLVNSCETPVAHEHDTTICTDALHTNEEYFCTANNKTLTLKLAFDALVVGFESGQLGHLALRAMHICCSFLKLHSQVPRFRLAISTASPLVVLLLSRALEHRIEQRE